MYRTSFVILLMLTLSMCDGAQTRNTNIKGSTMKAIFAGGCFWCMESPFEKISGVQAVESGYTGGHRANPTYEEVCTGSTGHTEAVEITYDPKTVGYLTLLDHFWRSIDPTDANGQFVDQGNQYRPAIFFTSLPQQRLAEATKASLAKAGVFKKPIVVEIVRAGTFYPAEEYHQGFSAKDPVRYCNYRAFSGRDQFLSKAWQGSSWRADTVSISSYIRPSPEAIKATLEKTSFNVTQCSATEPPFNNAYWDNHRQGIYIDPISGEPLFSSSDKFDSGTGWPSFTRALTPDHIVTKNDNAHGMQRIEVRSKIGNAHLGHLFSDGPAPSHQRFCINSAALQFIPREDLTKEGYGNLQYLFIDR